MREKARVNVLCMWCTVACISFTATKAVGTTVYDSINSDLSYSATGGIQNYPVDDVELHAFSFTSSSSVSLEQIDLLTMGNYASPQPPAGSLYLMTDNGGVPGTLLSSWGFSLPTEPIGIVSLPEPSFVPVSLSAGQKYWIVVSDPVPGTAVWLPLATTTTQTQLTMVSGSAWQPLTYWSDAQFRVQGTPVPEPGSFVLAAIAALALVAIRRGRRAH